MTMIDLFQAIKYVSSGLTLAAFVVATVAGVFRARLQNRKDLIALAEPRERADLVERTLEFFAVNTEGLTREQQYQLALRQIEARAERFRLILRSGIIVAVIAAVLTVLLVVIKAGGTPTPAPRQLTLVKFKGDDARFPVNKYYSFMAKVIDQNSNPAAGVKVMWTTPVGGDHAYVDVTNNDGTSTATNIYTFPVAGKYEQVATITAPETSLGFTSSSRVRTVGPRVTFVFSQATEAAAACSDGTYSEGSNFQWTLTRDIDTFHFVRMDQACTADFTFADEKWDGTLRCAGGATYAAELFPSESCNEVRSSLNWFTLRKGQPTRDLVTARYVTYAVSGTFQQGYRLSDDSKVVVDSSTGLEVSANVAVEGPDSPKEQFVGRPVYNIDRMWQWQNQGSKGGSLDFQDQQHTFVRYHGGFVLTNSAYWTPAIGHNVVSADTVFTPVSNSETYP